MKFKKKKKPKWIKILEEGDLFFNLVMSIWLLGLVLVFSNFFKTFLPYKNALVVQYSLISTFLINFIFKTVDIYAEYTNEALSDRVQREILAKRLKQKPLSEHQS